ncbi:MAG: ATP-binding protein [Clostridia bacterium]|nr:ATP-binding protein [Clostridia bacterium]
MVLSVRVDNYMIYSQDVELSLIADEGGRFDDNVYTESGLRVLKSACVYGANNSGKTCLISAIKSIKNIILNKGIDIHRNLYSKSNVCHLGISFLRNGRAFSYDFKYAFSHGGGTRGFVYECFRELWPDKEPETIFVREAGNCQFKANKDLEAAMKGFSVSNILIHVGSETCYPDIAVCKEILTDFAKNLDIVDTDKVPIKRTVSALERNTVMADKITELIRMADLNIDDFKYIRSGERDKGDIVTDEDLDDDDDGKYVLIAKDHLYSFRNGMPTQSLIYDSAGTNKIIAMAGYIVDALQNGKTLVIDGFDSGLHFKLTRALVLLFNSDSNAKGGQMIFSTHDVALLDCDTLFRQDQIWFVSNCKEMQYLNSLAEFGYSDDEVSSEFELVKKYRRGALGLIPRPDFPSIDFGEGRENGKG